MSNESSQEKIDILLEALKSIVKLSPGDIDEEHDEWGEAACFSESQRIAANALTEFHFDADHMKKLLSDPMDW